MNFRIAETFTAALNHLPTAEQKAVKTSAFDLQSNQSSPGLQLHHIDRARDPNFWSARAGRDLRIVFHRTGDSILLAYIDHHDKAYAWARRRRRELHPVTGVAQLVESPEDPAAVRHRGRPPQSDAPAPAPEPSLFEEFTDADLLAHGVPIDWLGAVRRTTPLTWGALARRLPADAAEALEDSFTAGRIAPPQPTPAVRDVSTADDLEHALSDPWPTSEARRRQAFHHYLQTDYAASRTGLPLPRPSADSYRSYIAGLALALRVRIDDALEREGPAALEERWLREGARLGIPPKTIGNRKSALRAYEGFLRFEQRKRAAPRLA